MGGDREEFAGGDGDVSSLVPACLCLNRGGKRRRRDWFGDEGDELRLGIAGFAECTRHQVSLYSHSENRKAAPEPPKDSRKLGALSPPGSGPVC